MQISIKNRQSTLQFFLEWHYTSGMSSEHSQLIIQILSIIKEKFSIILFILIVASVTLYLIFYNLQNSSDTNITVSNNDETEDSFIYVDLAGAIERPGIYKLHEGARVADLLVLGGDVLNESSEEWVSRQLNLAQVLTDSQKVYIPFEHDLENKRSLVASIPVQESTAVNNNFEPDSIDLNGVPSSAASDESEVSDLSKINVNTASQTELESLKGIGKVYAQKIIENRPYTNLAELISKTKIPESTLKKIESSLGF